MAKRIDQLPSGSALTGSEVIPGVSAGVTYSWTAVQFANYVATVVNAMPQNVQRTNYTLVLTDSGKHLYHPSDDPTPRTWTIPANSAVNFGLGTVVTFVNHYSAGGIVIACNDTMWLAGSTTTGNRTLAAGGVATALKVESTLWVISGSGLT